MISDAHGSKTPGDRTAVGRIAVPDKVVRCFIPREGIGDLTGDPLRCGISRHAERYQPPTLVPEDDQYEEQPEADCRHNQEVRGGDAGRMIAEESVPSLRRPSLPPRHVLGISLAPLADHGSADGVFSKDSRSNGWALSSPGQEGPCPDI